MTNRPPHRGLRAPALPVLLALATGLAACDLGKERSEVVTEVHNENRELRRQNLALMTENAQLRARALGQRPWTGTIALKAAGGAGGKVPFLRACPHGEALAGINGHAGTLVDEIVPACRRLDVVPPPAGPDAPTMTNELEPIGRSEGAAYERLCPPGSLLAGFRGRAGAAIDSLQPVCVERHPARIPATGDPATPSKAPATDDRPAPSKDPAPLPAVGGSGGQPFTRVCPDGWVAIGLSGRVESAPASIVVHCGRLEAP